MKITQRNPLGTTHFYLSFFLHLTISTTADPLYIPSENILINCGFPPNITSPNGRNWTTDVNSNFIFSLQPNTSTTSEASKQPISIPQIPYMTARLFYSQLIYSFPITPGPKFIRFYFYPSSYSGLDRSDAFFTVAAGQFTLLINFSPSLTTDYLNQDYLIKEFCINIDDHTLNITFTPSHSYGFVNGIEIISMPPNLYIRNEVLPFVGQLNWFEIDNYTALETVYRLNVGGNEIPPEEDTSGIFRAWSQDHDYILGGGYGATSKNTEVDIRYPSTVPPYTAPENLYRSSRFMGLDSTINIHKQLTWSFSMDTGFFYLFRLHFCETRDQITKPNQIVFYISIGNETSGDQMDVIKWSGGNGVPMYVDYVGMVVAEGSYRGKQDLWISLYPCIEAKPMYYDAILNGLEIFKLNRTDGNLAGSNPPSTKPAQAQAQAQAHSGFQSRQSLFVAGSAMAGGAVASCLVCFLVYRYRRNVKDMYERWVSLATNRGRYLSLVEMTT